MSDEPKDPLLLDHEADGIRELDNNLPRWWVWLFYLTIAFSFVYMHYYHIFRAGDLQAAAYEKERQAGEKLKAAAVARFESSLDSVEPSTDPAVLFQGQKTYTTLCAPCHRADGGGLVGPNLTDDYWIHGGTFPETLKIIVNGVPEKGMLSWRNMLKPDQIRAVASYIYTLRGTNPPNAKPPENQQQAAPEENIYE